MALYYDISFKLLLLLLLKWKALHLVELLKLSVTNNKNASFKDQLLFISILDVLHNFKINVHLRGVVSSLET